MKEIRLQQFAHNEWASETRARQETQSGGKMRFRQKLEPRLAKPNAGSRIFLLARKSLVLIQR